MLFVPCFRNPDESSPFIPDTYLDPALNYGSRYSYTIRSVFNFSLKRTTGQNESFIQRKYLVNSCYSKTLDVDCVETLPPPPPKDLSAYFDYSLKNRKSPGALRLTWSFPVNPQRDTAGFVVFRRRNIYEPFNVIRILDFNFSLPTAKRGRNYKFEIASYEKVTLLSGEDSYTNYLDKDFKHDTDYIYTLCSIDAHGHISGYSSQLLINFDSKLNRLSLEQMSPPGAPLLFPNWFLKTKAFQDVARVSNYRSATLKFRPDYKEIRTGIGGETKVKIVSGTDPDHGGHPDNAYFLQIINPDRSDDLVFKYQLNDAIEITTSSEDLEEVSQLLGVARQDLE